MNIGSSTNSTNTSGVQTISGHKTNSNKFLRASSQFTGKPVSYEEYCAVTDMIVNYLKDSKGISKKEIIAWCIEEAIDCDNDSQVGLKLWFEDI